LDTLGPIVEKGNKRIALERETIIPANQKRRAQSREKYDRYRAARDKLVRERPTLAGSVNAQAIAVRNRLKLPERESRTIRRALSEK
jgi:hypothetical protein